MTNALLQRFNHYNPGGVSWLFTLAVLILLPALIFRSFVPYWMPNFALGGVVILFLLRSAAIGRFIGHTPVDWPLLLLLILLLVGLWTTVNLEMTLPRTYSFIANLVLFWAIAAQRNTFWLGWSPILLLLAGLILAPILVLYTDFTGFNLSFLGQDIYLFLSNGLHPFWDDDGFNPNLTGGVLALFWIPAAVLIWKGETWQQRDIAKFVIVLLSIALILSQSRGAWLGVAVALLVITILQDRRWLLFWAIILTSIGIGALYLGSDRLLESMFGQSNVLSTHNLQSRQELWLRAIYINQDFALTGVGLGMVEPVIRLLYPTFLLPPEIRFNHVHNMYLQTGAELGLLGLVAHLSFYIVLFYLLLQRALDPNAGRNQILALGLLGSLITFLVQGFFDTITDSPQVAILVWGLFGLMMAVVTSSQADQSTPSLE